MFNKDFNPLFLITQIFYIFNFFNFYLFYFLFGTVPTKCCEFYNL